MRQIRGGVVLPVLIWVSGAAHAQSPAARDSVSTFDSLDADQSSFLTLMEVQSSVDVAARFMVADKNRDGMLSRAEFDAAFPHTPTSPVKPQQPRAPQT